MYKRVVAPIAALLLILSLCLCKETYSAAAAEMTDIRVGLTEIYCGVPSVTIYNDTIALGYCINDSYKTEESFTGGSGFTFSAATGYFSISNSVYGSYKAALAETEKIKELGVEAYPAALYRGTWKVYISGKAYEADAEKDYMKALKAGFDVSKPSGDNSHRLMVTSKNSTFLIDGKTYNCYPQFKAGAKNKSGAYVLNLGSRQYRGRIEIGRYGKSTLTTVNILNIEAYLKSVLPCEMTSSWHSEALKAQAVCSRSYAVSKAGYGSSSDAQNAYSITDTTSSQVYKGYTFETKLTTEAVAATRGVVVKYKGSIIPAYFFSTSGGATENGMDVWGLKQSCFIGVPDIYETAPERLPWIVKTTYADVRKLLSANGMSIGMPDRIFPKITTASGRILELEVKSGTQGITLSSDQVRSILKLPSTKVRVVSYGDRADTAYARGVDSAGEIELRNACAISAGGTVAPLSTELEQYVAVSSTNMMNFPRVSPASSQEVYFAGMGYGHGVGMSQSGARKMAEMGYSYREIIEYYFNGAVCG